MNDLPPNRVTMSFRERTGRFYTLFISGSPVACEWRRKQDVEDYIEHLHPGVPIEWRVDERSDRTFAA